LEKYIDTFITSFLGTVDWTLQSISFTVPWYTNYFWGLILISLLIWGLEILFPWRKNQGIIRKDFWLDAGYMFFNFFIFSIVISGFYAVLEILFSEVHITTKSLSIIDLNGFPVWLQLLIFFIFLDFVQWFTHTLLHRFSFFWKYHKVHHSVKEMGFAAHLRYHGFEPEQAYIIHFIAIAIGHLNHSNLKITWGPLKYIINNPVMHLYHHAKELPEGRFGVNFGISLSLWDYIFKTNYIPEESGTIALGFDDDEQFPKKFISQITHGFVSKRER